MKARSLGSITQYQPKRRHRKLTQEDIDAIRLDAANGVPQKALAYQHGVHPVTISNIVRGASRKAVKPESTPAQRHLMIEWQALRRVANDLAQAGQFTEAEIAVQSMRAIERELNFVPEPLD